MSSRGTGYSSVLTVLARSAALYGAAIAASAGRRLAITLFGYLFAVGLFAVSLGFLTSSAHAAITQALGGIYASLIVGCFYFVAGLVAMLVLQFRRR